MITKARGWINRIVRPQVFERGIEVGKAAVLQRGTGFVDEAGGAVPFGCAVVPSGGTVVVASHGAVNTLGVNANDDGSDAALDEGILVGRGLQLAKAAVLLSEGDLLKAYYGGALGPLCTAAKAGGVIDTATAGGNFGNQPADDAVDVVSGSAADVTQQVTIYGTTHGDATLAISAETVTLTGTDAVTTTKDDWGVILGVVLSAACAGTVTVSESSGSATITTITAGVTSAGVVNVPEDDQVACGVAPTAVAGGASTKYVGVMGRPTTGSTVVGVAKQQNGTTAVTFGKAFETITMLLVGDAATATATTLARGAEETTEGKAVGVARADAEEGALFEALVY